ncbi:MAG: hypothetical protein LRY55_14350 [Leadbetterella sp.]|nr:hypothetical protein [Leadbetterella sp.]
MKKLLLLFSGLLISLVADAQKIICVTDSTTLKSYFGKTRQVISVRNNQVTVGTQVTVDSAPPKSEGQGSAGLPGGPIVRVTRNDNAAILRKELNAATRLMDWPSVLSSMARLQYHAFVNTQGKIDSLAYYLVRIDTLRAGRRFQMKEQIDRIEKEEFRVRLENQWRDILKNYTGLAESPKSVYAGYIPIYDRIKDLDGFLRTRPDTITQIDLVDYGLKEFPYQLKRFRKLKRINLKDNFISSATLDKKDFPKLTSISFQNNLMRDGSLKFTGGSGPATINLNDNYLTRIPKTHRKVKHLHLANSAIHEVTAGDIRNIKRLRVLNLYANTLTELPPKISRMRKLKELDLYRNRLSTLPATVTRMKRLETLAVSYNTLEDLPARIRSMKSLKTLYSHHNRLKTLPMLPKKLEILDVGHNRLEEVSAQVQPLQKLKTLDYSHNQVKGDLTFLLSLPQIKEIYLLENRYAATEEEEKYFSTIFTTLVGKGVTVK